MPRESLSIFQNGNPLSKKSKSPRKENDRIALDGVGLVGSGVGFFGIFADERRLGFLDRCSVPDFVGSVCRKPYVLAFLHRI